MRSWDSFDKLGSILQHRIKIKLYREQLEDGLDIDVFNPNHVNVIHVSHEWGFDSISLFLIHKEFPKRKEGCSCDEYWLPEAQKRFPFLFEITNPILYRKF